MIASKFVTSVQYLKRGKVYKLVTVFSSIGSNDAVWALRVLTQEEVKAVYSRAESVAVHWSDAERISIALQSFN